MYCFICASLDSHSDIMQQPGTSRRCLSIEEEEIFEASVSFNPTTKGIPASHLDHRFMA